MGSSTAVFEASKDVLSLAKISCCRKLSEKTRMQYEIKWDRRGYAYSFVFLVFGDIWIFAS